MWGLNEVAFFRPSLYYGDEWRQRRPVWQNRERDFQLETAPFSWHKGVKSPKQSPTPILFALFLSSLSLSCLFPTYFSLLFSRVSDCHARASTNEPILSLPVSGAFCHATFITKCTTSVGSAVHLKAQRRAPCLVASSSTVKRRKQMVPD